MNSRGFLVLIVLLALLAGAGAFLLLRGATDEPAPAATPASAEPDAPPVVLPQGDDAPSAFNGQPGDSAVAVPVGIDTSGAPSTVIGRAVDRTGRGLQGARITTFSRDDDAPFRTRHALTITETAGPDGRFRLLGLPVGTELGVEVVDDDHAPATREPFRARRDVEVDLGEIVLDAGFDLHGRVTGAEGEPLAGATVTLADVTTSMGRHDEATERSTLSDADGNYRFEHLGPRQYDIEAEAEGYGRVGVVLSMIFGGMPSEWRQDFHLDRADSALRGWVIGPDERGVPDALLVLSRQVPQGNTYFLQRTTTGADGRFDFADLPAGLYDLDLNDDDHYLDRPAQLQAAVADQTVRVQSALVVHGKILGDGPVAGFRLVVQPDGRTGAGLLGNAAHERSFKGDAFEIGGLRPGSYRFEARVEGYAPTASSDVILAPGQLGTEVQILLVRGGTFIGSLQPPQAGARVELRESDWDPAGPIEATFPTAPAHGLVTTTGEDGSFRFEQVPPETYVLTARPAGAPPIHVRDVLSRDRETTDVGPLPVQRGGTLFGNVVGADGRVRQGVRVSAGSATHQAQAVTDAQGAFRLEALPPGEYEVSATPGSLWEALRFQASTHVLLEPGEELGVELPLVERTQGAPR